MTFIDYYKTLGINKTATPKEIKTSYRKLARKFHPDLNPNDKDAKRNFQQINEANEVLSDLKKRKKYDQYGKDWQHAEQFEQAKQQQGQSSDFREQRYSGARSGGDFSDFFESMLVDLQVPAEADRLNSEEKIIMLNYISTLLMLSNS